MRLLKAIRDKLQPASSSLVSSLDRLFTGRGRLSGAALGELEDLLLAADCGLALTEELVAWTKEESKARSFSSPTALREALFAALLEKLQPYQGSLGEKEPLTVELFVGLNGSGKTTTLAKIAGFWKKKGGAPLLIGADTFRAAALEQLKSWGEKIGCPVFGLREGADPGAVVFDGLAHARAKGHTHVLIDTAGRMQTKLPLMEQLKKIERVIGKATGNPPRDTLLVLDAPTGQSALTAARAFCETLPITQLILTKLDGTAKGGTLLAIAQELKIPIAYLGIGEGMEDLIPFDAAAYLAALLELSPIPPVTSPDF